MEQLSGLVRFLSSDVAAIANIDSSPFDSSPAGSSPAGSCTSDGYITDASIAEAIGAVEAAGRLMDAARVRAIAPLVADPALFERLGYESPVAAVASIARISEHSARARLKIARAVCPAISVSGAHLPPTHPVIAAALDSGRMGLDAAGLVAHELGSLAGRTPVDALEFAETVMVELATGVSSHGEEMVATVSVDYLAGEVRQVAAAVDPDGARPREERSKRRREFRMGAPDEDGLVPAHGRLMPEVGSLLLGLLEAHRRSPRFAESATTALDGNSHAGDEARTPDAGIAILRDPRTPAQRRHDALAEILMAAARADGTPRLDGALVSVVVTVRDVDFSDPDGVGSDPIGTMAGSPFPVSRDSVERFIDAGGYRVVKLDKHGASMGISSLQRCFTSIQRISIAARDGYRCSAPGCSSPHFTL